MKEDVYEASATVGLERWFRRSVRKEVLSLGPFVYLLPLCVSGFVPSLVSGV